MFLNLFLGGLFDVSLGLDSDFFNLTTILCFTGVASAFGYILLAYTNLSVALSLSVAALLALGVTILLNIFVFIPLSKMESSTAFKIEELQGELGEVTLRIPAYSVGEVLVRTPLGIVSRTAKSYDHQEIGQGEKVLIIEVKENVFYVIKYNENFDYFDYVNGGEEGWK
ncbi:MAG: hypothetical protein ACI4XL_12515 [Bacillus sp. (in: firmicutes)]